MDLLQGEENMKKWEKAMDGRWRQVQCAKKQVCGGDRVWISGWRIKQCQTGMQMPNILLKLSKSVSSPVK